MRARTSRTLRAGLPLPLAVVASCGDRSAAGGSPARAAGPPATAARSPRDTAAATALADTLVARIREAYDFSRPDVVARLLDLYAPTDPVISAAAGQVTTTRAALTRAIGGFWDRVGQNMRAPRFVVGERHVTVLGPDAAVLTLTYAIPHETPQQQPHTLAGAWTAVFVRRDGRWVIVQEHLSDLPARPVAAQVPPAPR